MTPERVGLAPVNRAGVAADSEGIQYLCFQGDLKSLDYLAGVRGLRYWGEWNCVALPVSRTNLLMLETLGRLEEASEEYVGLRNETLAAPRKWDYPTPVDGAPAPFHHQRDAFNEAVTVFDRGGKGFANFAQMGTGKSRMAIDLMREFVEESALIVVQNSTALQWKQNLETLWPNASVTMLTGDPMPKRIEKLQALKERLGRNLDVVVVNWEALGKLAPELCKIGFDMMVIDEATRAKERTTTMSKAAYAVGKTALWRVAMTGTPFGNSPADIWAIFRFVDDTVFGKRYWDFANKYFLFGGFNQKQVVGFKPEMLPEFIEKLYSCSFRITKSSITDMPPKCYEVVRLPLEGEQRDLYEKVKKDLYASLVDESGETRTLTVANALVAVTRLQQITAGLFPSNDGEPSVTPIKSVKTEWVTNFVSDLAKDTQDCQVVVWARFKKEIEVLRCSLMASGVQVGVISGDTPNEEREALRVAFNDRGNPLRVLVIQLQAGAYGLDIPGADTMVFATNSFSYLERSQAEDRGHRLGRTRNYNIIDLAIVGTVDVEVLAALREKGNLAESLLIKGFLGIPVENGTKIAESYSVSEAMADEREVLSLPLSAQ